ncbi:serine/threonine-protein kinase [Streptomyces sp. WMMC500]|uniref:serine/threonine-protein kinase n=1 Tax=Streptomyces sp. WMMC500 TaxID=3015154 RepID=UPI00248AEFD9|nr:serine/threonine-protein kinase [Streptomyces sp. WMMC500]WBB62562.1 serine/threonine-protein kinase [Streptomyces sp. WMMC500]
MTEVPTRIGRYTVERELGAGGMGQVYLAYSPGGDPVAVKVIRNDRLDQATRARFEREALIARTVVGTNRVARFLDADPYADEPWMAVEYVPGRTVHEQVGGAGTLPVPLVASLGALLAEGLEAVHAVDLLHRDLKPQNVMLGEYGPILIDFGLGAFLDASKDTLTHDGMIIGTVRCMPPEQALGRSPVQTPADVYGLGTVLLYAAAGHYPYDGQGWPGIVAQVADETRPPDLSGAPEALVPLLTAMLAHTAADRPALAEVTDRCVELMRRTGFTPVAARYALIDVAAPFGGANGRPGPSPRVWERVATQYGDALDVHTRIMDEDGIDSPLDRRGGLDPTQEGEGSGSAGAEPVGGKRAGDGLAPGDAEVGPHRPPATGGTPAEPPRRPGRKPASHKVAEELRSRYAMQAAL